MSGKDFEVIPSITSVLDRYDGFLVDQWGVMHNGVEALAHANECIQFLAKANKKLVILSNSPANEGETMSALPGMGFDPTHFCGAVTSGTLAQKHIRVNYPKSKALFFGWSTPTAPGSEKFLEECGGIELIDWKAGDPDSPLPEVIILQGNEVILGPKTDGRRSSTSLGDFVTTGKMSGIIDSTLTRCAKHNVPLLCVDPDFIFTNSDGVTYYMPGTVAKRYNELGGKSVYFGKPDEACFQEGIDRLVKQGVKDSSRIAMIGDSLHHDVKGANSVGLDSILVLGGVHQNDLGHTFGTLAPRSKLQILFDAVEQTPTFVAPLLKV